MKKEAADLTNGEPLRVICVPALRGMGAMRPFLCAAAADVLVRILCGGYSPKPGELSGSGGSSYRSYVLKYLKD